MERPCDACGRTYTARSSRSRYCSDQECRRQRERVRKRRGAAGGQVIDLTAHKAKEPEDAREAGPIEAATRERLAAAERESTPEGLNALRMARELDGATGQSGSSMQALSKQHLAALDKAMEGAAVAADPIDRIRDELRDRREKKRSGAKG